MPNNKQCNSYTLCTAGDCAVYVLYNANSLANYAVT